MGVGVGGVGLSSLIPMPLSLFFVHLEIYKDCTTLAVASKTQKPYSSMSRTCSFLAYVEKIREPGDESVK